MQLNSQALDTRSAKVVGVGETPSNFWCIPLFKFECIDLGVFIGSRASGKGGH